MGWTEHASCRAYAEYNGHEAAYEVFFPKDPRTGYAKARLICASCPVTRECLEEAYKLRDFHGVRAGMSPSELAMEIRKPRMVTRQPVVTGKKYCTRCDQVREISDFYPNKHRRDGVAPYCKTCDIATNRAYRRSKLRGQRKAS